MKNEIKIGLFMFFAIVIFAFGVIILGDVHLKKGYIFKVLFDDIGGLSEDSPVRIAGVEVGKVSKIYLSDDGKAIVEVWIKEDVKIRKNAKAEIVSTGVIGTKYIELTLGTKPNEFLKPGDEVLGESPQSIEKVASRVVSGINKLVALLSGKEGKNDLREIIVNIKQISHKLNSSIKGKTIDETIKNFNEFSRLLKDISKEQDSIRKAMKELPGAIRKFENTMKELEDIVKKVKNGEGVFGKLLTDEDVAKETEDAIKSFKGASKEAERVLKRISGFRTYWNYNMRYNFLDNKTRSDFGIMIKPRKTKFYYFGVRNIKDAGSGDDSGGQKINGFDAQIGSRVKNFTFYGGIIGGTGGAGIIFHPMKLLDIETKAYYFSKQKPFVDAGIRIRLSPFLSLNLGGEDLLNRKGFYGGFNLLLEDEDIGYLFGLGSLAGAVNK